MKPLSNKMYDIIKWIALLVLPTLIGAVIAIGEVWSVPVEQNLIASLTGLSTAIGVLLTLSSSIYYITGKEDLPVPSIPVKVYKLIQDITLYWLPAFSTAYYGLSLVIHMHYVMPIIETAVIVQVFLGLIMGTYSSQTGSLKDWAGKNLADIVTRFKQYPGSPRG